MQQPPPQWNQPVPGAPPGPSPAKRLETLGTVSLALSILALLYSVVHVLNQVFGKSLLKGQRALMPTLPNAQRMDGMMDAAESLMSRISLWETLRTLPFVMATGVLLWIALRLRKGDTSALSTARTWMYGAFAAIAASLLIQILVIVPAMMDYQQRVVETIPLPTGPAAPIDVKQMTSSIVLVSTLFGVIGGTLFSAVWPIVLHVWAGRLQREMSPPR